MLKLISLVLALKIVETSALRSHSQTLKPFLRSSFSLYNTMTHGVKKENLPSKMCVTCNRPFTWRKKWERCWDEVTTCSKGCNAKRRASAKKDGHSIPDESDEEKENDEDDADKGLPVAEKSAHKIDSGAKSTESSSKVRLMEPAEMLNEVDDTDADEINEVDGDSPIPEKKLSRKKLQKLKMKEMEGETSKKDGPLEKTKSCAVCKNDMTLLFRCQWDASKQWRFVCEYITELLMILRDIKCVLQTYFSTSLKNNLRSI